MLKAKRQEKNPIKKAKLKADIQALVPSEEKDVMKEIKDLVLKPSLKFAKLLKK